MQLAEMMRRSWQDDIISCVSVTAGGPVVTEIPPPVIFKPHLIHTVNYVFHLVSN